MKYHLFFTAVVIFMLTLNSFGQEEKTREYCYAQVFITETSQGKSVIMNFGEEYPIQVEQKDEISKKVSSYKNIVDIMNYLSDQGWEFVEHDFEIRVMSDNVRSSSHVFSYYTFRKAKVQP